MYNSVLVSVIMPVFNGEKYICEAIESVLNQTYKNIELLMIDDCSTDGSLLMMKSYNDERIKIITHRENKGIATSTNEGLQIAKGRYISLLDNDDIFELDKLEKQVEYLESHQEIDVLGGRCHFIDERGTLVAEGAIPRFNPNINHAQLLFSNIEFVNSSVIYRNKFIKDNGLRYREDTYGMQDYLFFVEASKVGKISAIVDFVVKYRFHSENLSKFMKNSFKEQREEKYKAIRNYSLQIDGFQIDDVDLTHLNEVLKEGCEKVNDYKEWFEIKKIFHKLLIQAEKNNKEYINELKIVEKKIMVTLLQSFEFLDE